MNTQLYENETLCLIKLKLFKSSLNQQDSLNFHLILLSCAMIFQRVSNITTNINIYLMHMMCYFSQENSTNTEVCILIIARGSKIKDKLK